MIIRSNYCRATMSPEACLTKSSLEKMWSAGSRPLDFSALPIAYTFSIEHIHLELYSLN